MCIGPSRLATALALVIPTVSANVAHAQKLPRFPMPEQRQIEVREPTQLPPAHLPRTRRPTTVATPAEGVPAYPMSLDEAIRITLEDSEVIRVLAGVTAVSSGRSIYDPAISNTEIDRQQARFDPNLEVRNDFNRFEPPAGAIEPTDPTRARIAGTRTDDYNLGLDVSKQTTLGGTARFGFSTNRSRFRPGVFPLNPRDRSAAELSYTHPLLQGSGFGPNLAPIVIARIDTERSYFQLKSSLQDSVVGVIQAYWALVTARTDVWAREKQVEQAQWAYDQTAAKTRQGLQDIGDLSQSRTALANFRSNLISAQANLLQREAALRNIMGLPPVDSRQIVPVTAPTAANREFDWVGLTSLAEQRRPDLIELKLIIEADEQLLIQARNQAYPRLDAIMLYRWNGLEGEMPIGDWVSSGTGQFTDWTMGVNFSVPLGLRQSRADLRRQELIITRDWANLRQGLHQVVHELALDVRNLAQYYEQYKAFKETRAAAHQNLEVQQETYRRGLTDFINVLVAISDWGNAVSSEAQALGQYNAELANLERETGTILETHGIRFTEERFASIGPLGRLGKCRFYPSGLRPLDNADRYPKGTEPAEQSFGLEDPVQLPAAGSPPRRIERLPPPVQPTPLP